MQPEGIWTETVCRCSAGEVGWQIHNSDCIAGALLGAVHAFRTGILRNAKQWLFISLLDKLDAHSATLAYQPSEKMKGFGIGLDFVIVKKKDPRPLSGFGMPIQWREVFPFLVHGCHCLSFCALLSRRRFYSRSGFDRPARLRVYV